MTKTHFGHEPDHVGRGGNHGFDGDDDDGGAPCIDPGTLGLGHSIQGFIRLVDAILVHPDNGLIAAGRNGATDAASSLFWTYDPHAGLRVRAEAGYLTTKTGDGGFSLAVRPDGSWSLSFDGTHKVIGHDAGHGQKPPPPPAAGLPEIDLPGSGPAGFDASKLPPSLINGGLGWDTVQGGVGDYIIGGSGTLGGGLAGNGNCAVYTASPGSVLVDMQNGFGYGANAEGNVYSNINQARGSFFSNVLIGNSNGTDLKSGGDNSLLISTGGVGFELRPDGSGNVLVSTAGGDRLTFDPSHAWKLGDENNIMLGFNLDHGATIDLRPLMGGGPIGVVGGPSITSNFHAVSAAGYSAVTGTGDITDYLKMVDQADGSHLLFSASGQVATAGTELIDLKFTHGLDVATMYANHQILA